MQVREPTLPLFHLPSFAPLSPAASPLLNCIGLVFLTPWSVSLVLAGGVLEGHLENSVQIWCVWKKVHIYME